MSDSSPAGEGAEVSDRVPQLGGRWRKSSYSMSNGDCIEVADLAKSTIGVRDSKAIAGSCLRFSPGAWTAFVGDVRRSHSAVGRI
jgi:Domain of unknown function (DUF397)